MSPPPRRSAACPRRNRPKPARPCGRARPAPRPRRSSPASSIRELPPLQIARRRLRRSLPQPHRRRRTCARASPCIRASPSGGRSKRACSRPTSSSSARSTTARGRRPPIPGRGSTARCARSSACRRPRRKSATRRTISPRCSAPNASIITRAEKIDGVPTVPSRWLMRLEALLAGLELADASAARSAVARLGTRARPAQRSTAHQRAGAAPAARRCARAR